MALQLRLRIIERLQALNGKPQTARELAQWLFEAYPEECAEKKANRGSYVHTDADLIQQLVAEIGSRRPQWQQKHPELKTTEGRPRRYYWTVLEASAEVAAAEQEPITPTALTQTPQTQTASSAKSLIGEHALYPLLREYLASDELNVYSLRIDEKRSSNRAGSGANEWLHPDLVGLEDLTSEWTRELRDCVAVMQSPRARLWSFEVKVLLNRSNARKSFFQTVSNSSWAHFGYLVAATIEGDGTLKELRMLAAAHGIGVIQLDVENPSESQILIPAKERTEIDWDMCNRLIEENQDFAEFIARVRRFHQVGEISVREWQ